VLDASVVFLVDISCAGLQSNPDFLRRLVWIDHHRTAMEQWGNASAGIRIDGVAACRLAWYWWTSHPLCPEPVVPPPIQWDDQQEGEPGLVFLAGLRDAWRHTGTIFREACDRLSLGLYAPGILDLERHLEADERTQVSEVMEVIKSGEKIGAFVEEINHQNATEGAMLLDWEGVRWVCLNTTAKGSRTLHSTAQRLEQSGHNIGGLFVWAVTARGECSVSLYHAPRGEGLDLSAIAKARGGGGHRGACGFRTSLDWMAATLAKSQPAVIHQPNTA
jgi:hypothetical protein